MDPLTITLGGAESAPVSLVVLASVDDDAPVLEHLVFHPEVTVAQARALRQESEGAWTAPLR